MDLWNGTLSTVTARAGIDSRRPPGKVVPLGSNAADSGNLTAMLGGEIVTELPPTIPAGGCRPKLRH